MHFPLGLCAVLIWVLPNLGRSAPTAASSTHGATLILEIPVTSNACIPKGSQWGAMIQALTGTRGLLDLSYSRESADSNTIDVYVDFESESTATRAQKLVTSGMGYRVLHPILDGPIASYVVKFDQTRPVQTLNGAGDTELAVFYLDPNATARNITDFETAFATLRTAVESAAGEVFATSGWVAGEARNPSLDIAVPTYVALVGWESQASHEKFTKTNAFETAIEGLLPYLSGDFDSDDELVLA